MAPRNTIYDEFACTSGQSRIQTGSHTARQSDRHTGKQIDRQAYKYQV